MQPWSAGLQPLMWTHLRILQKGKFNCSRDGQWLTQSNAAGQWYSWDWHPVLPLWSVICSNWLHTGKIHSVSKPTMANYSRQGKSGCLSLCINKVLLEDSLTHLFTYCPAAFHYNRRAEHLGRRPHGPHIWKDVRSDFYWKSLPIPALDPWHLQVSYFLFQPLISYLNEISLNNH